jgi:hypothetical protein
LSNWWTFLNEWFDFLKKICRRVDNRLDISVEWRQKK